MQDPSALSLQRKRESTNPLVFSRARKSEGGEFSSHSHLWNRGFTLIEILVVLAIVALLLTISLPRYFQSVDVAKERVLMENLRTTRDSIDKFYGDTGRYPDSLEELIDEVRLDACIPFEQDGGSGICVLCGQPATEQAIFAKSY